MDFVTFLDSSFGRVCNGIETLFDTIMNILAAILVFVSVIFIAVLLIVGVVLALVVLPLALVAATPIFLIYSIFGVELTVDDDKVCADAPEYSSTVTEDTK